MVLRSAIASDLRCELADQVRVRARIDLALEQLRRRAHGERRYFLAQAFPRAVRFEIDLRLSGRNQALAFLRGGRLRLIDDLVRAVLRLVDDLLRAFTRFADDRVGIA